MASLSCSVWCGVSLALAGEKIRRLISGPAVRNVRVRNVRGGLLCREDIPQALRTALGETHGQRIDTLVTAMIDYGTVSYSDIFLTDTAGEGFARTYGKGIMQTSYSNTSTGEAVKLTSAQIYWPKGNSIHGKGVDTDDGAVAVRAASFGEYADAELTEILSRIAA